MKLKIKKLKKKPAPQTLTGAQLDRYRHVQNVQTEMHRLILVVDDAKRDAGVEALDAVHTVLWAASLTLQQVLKGVKK